VTSLPLFTESTAMNQAGGEEVKEEGVITLPFGSSFGFHKTSSVKVRFNHLSRKQKLEDNHKTNNCNCYWQTSFIYFFLFVIIHSKNLTCIKQRYYM